MKKMRKVFLLMLSTLALLIPTTYNVAAASFEPANANELIILHTNDMHGQMDPIVQELAYLKAYKEKVDAFAIFDAGDASQGLPLNNITKGANMGIIMDKIGYDAMAVGNHEFDYSRDSVLGKEDGFFKASNFPKLGTNVYFTSDSTAGTPGTPVFETSIKMDAVVDGKTYTFSVFGLTTPETYVKADPRHSEGIEFRDPIESLRKEMAQTEHADSDYYVILQHLGTDPETKAEWRGNTVAESLSKDPALADEKFIVIDGHSHTEYPEGVRYGDNVLYGQTGGSLGTFGEMRINLDNFTESKLRTVPMRDKYVIHPDIEANLDADPEIVGLLEQASEEFEELTKEVVKDNNEIYLEGDRAFARTRETNLGNLITDATYEYALDTFPEFSHISVLNGGGIRSSIDKGPITLKQIITVQPYGNRIVQIDVKGSDVLAMYEHALKAPMDEENVDEKGLPLLTSDPAILHSSDSVRVKFDPRLEPGKRVLSIDIIDEETHTLVPLDPDKTYKIVTLEFLAVGGDGFEMLGGARVEGGNDADIFADYLRQEKEGLIDIDWTRYAEDLPPQRVIPTNGLVVEEINVMDGLIANANELLLLTENYTEASLAALQTAVDKAIVEVDRMKLEDTMNEETEAIKNALIKAIEDLVPVEPAVNPKVEAFRTLLAKAKTYVDDKDKYTVESYEAFKLVYDEAVELDGKLNMRMSLDEQIDDVTLRLNKAIDNLELVVVKKPDKKPDVNTGIGNGAGKIIGAVSLATLAGAGWLYLRRKED